MADDHKPRSLFPQFPKKRVPLPVAYQKIYAAYYRQNRNGASPATSLGKRMESWMHRRTAADAPGANSPTLEVGAGSLNHFYYEPSTAPYDIVEPFEELYEDSPFRKRVRNAYKDIRCVPLEPQYARIISIAAFEHICDLPAVVAICGLLLREGGHLRVGIPSEGSVLWKLGWSLTTGVEYRLKHGLDYGLLMRYEHVNTAAEIVDVLSHFFGVLHSRVFGVSCKMSFYQFHECARPDLQRCTDYISSL